MQREITAEKARELYVLKRDKDINILKERVEAVIEQEARNGAWSVAIEIPKDTMRYREISEVLEDIRNSLQDRGFLVVVRDRQIHVCWEDAYWADGGDKGPFWVHN